MSAPAASLRPRLLLVMLAATVAFVGLAIAAAVDGGDALLRLDRPVTRWFVEHRTAWLDDVMVALTHLGNGGVVLAVGVFLAVVVAPVDRVLALIVAIVPAVRPFLISMLKAIVDRERPNIEPLTAATETSFPSGHVAAAAMWFLLPLVISVLAPRSRAVPITVAIAAVFTVVVAVTRVYMGVHWATDVVGGALVGLVLMTGVWAVAHRPPSTSTPPSSF